ncbi:MAG TPA: cobalamin-binding protein [Bacteriovoracaceae bacterium]|nr:cobalamin-binding protein [Bacteriovoracaceae bacterium]
MSSFPSKIICLTEESVETLYLLGRSDLIKGVSQYVERPPEAKLLPHVSQFIRSDIEKIVALQPDLVLGFSDLQKDIARDLIGRGLNVFVTNQRSLEEILGTILLLGRLVGAGNEAEILVEGFRLKLSKARSLGAKLPRRPKVYFEEWDHPRLSGIGWASEIIEATGGENIFKHKSGALAQDRKVTDEEIIALNPDIIFGCWCGKAVKIEAIRERAGYSQINAVRTGQIWELPPEIFLQPGPALFVDGLDQMSLYFQRLFHP